MQSFSGLVHEYLHRRSISLRCLALELGLSPSTLCRWVSGKQVPTPKSCHRLSDHMSVPVAQVLALAGHLKPSYELDADNLPEFREYARQKYPRELDEDIIAMIEDLIRRKRDRGERDRRIR